MIEVFPKTIDPERVEYQLNKLVSAILGNARDEFAAEMAMAKAAKSAPFKSKPSKKSRT